MRNPIVREMGFIVQGINEKLTPILKERHPDVRCISYDYGHPTELVQRLKLKTKSRDQRFEKFPCVLLLEDIRQLRRAGAYDKVNLHIVIAMSSEQGYFSSDRQEKTFEPVLYPIYDALMEAIAKRHGYFHITNPKEDMAHDYYDRKYWGKEGLYGNEGNQFNDYLDAIEIIGLELDLTRPRC